MNQQEMFNRSWQKYVVEQAPPGMNPVTHMCSYRRFGACMVGNLLPDDIYDEDMEIYGISTVLKQFPKIREFLGEENGEFLSALQDAHDESAPTSYFHMRVRTELTQIAIAFKLTIPVAENG